MLRVSPIMTVREGFEKIASSAEVVVFGHRALAGTLISCLSATAAIPDCPILTEEANLT
jgi:hypothetical protein